MTKPLSSFTVDRLFVSLGVAKLAAVFLFFASFGLVGAVPAQAQSSAACVGENLLVKLEDEDPLAYRQIIAQARETENSESIFWKVEKEGKPVSYLFGTMHMADPEISTLPEDVKSAIGEVDKVVVESVDALDPAKSQQAMAGLQHLLFLTQGTLSDLVEDDLEDELAEAVQARGVPMELANRMQPWLVATMISLPVCEAQRKQTGELVLDAVLANHAVEAGKGLEGLETAAEQLEAIASLPVDYHVSALEETLVSGDIALDMIETMKASYLAGDMGVIFPLMKAVLPKAGSGEGAAQFQEALIEKRNFKMVERVLPFLEKGSLLMAVGALHLPGETGIVTLLRKEGYTVTTLR